MTNSHVEPNFEDILTHHFPLGLSYRLKVILMTELSVGERPLLKSHPDPKSWKYCLSGYVVLFSDSSSPPYAIYGSKQSADEKKNNLSFSQKTMVISSILILLFLTHIVLVASQAHNLIGMSTGFKIGSTPQETARAVVDDDSQTPDY